MVTSLLDFPGNCEKDLVIVEEALLETMPELKRELL